MKGWLLPNSSRDNSAPLIKGTAVAGFVQRVSAEVEIISCQHRAPTCGADAASRRRRHADEDDPAVSCANRRGTG
jgi:hypothetical protein